MLGITTHSAEFGISMKISLILPQNAYKIIHLRNYVSYHHNLLFLFHINYQPFTLLTTLY